MDRYIGLDAHASSCTVATVGPSGRRLHSQVVETKAGALVRVLRGVPGTRNWCRKGGTSTSWSYQVLSHRVEHLRVARDVSVPPDVTAQRLEHVGKGQGPQGREQFAVFPHPGPGFRFTGRLPAPQRIDAIVEVAAQLTELIVFRR